MPSARHARPLSREDKELIAFSTVIILMFALAVAVFGGGS